MWERLWIFRFSSREKLLLQVGQRWGFSLVCVRMWISILYLQSKSRLQWGWGSWLLSTAKHFNSWECLPPKTKAGLPARAVVSWLTGQEANKMAMWKRDQSSLPQTFRAHWSIGMAEPWCHPKAGRPR